MILKRGIMVLAFLVVLGTVITGDVFAQRSRRERAPRERAPLPVLGQPTDRQQLMNALPAIPIAGRQLKFQFGGDFWIATLNGRNFIAGGIATEEVDGGTVLRLKHTHTWPPTDLPNALLMRWIPTPGPQINLIYREEPRRSLRVYRPGEPDDDE